MILTKTSRHCTAVILASSLLFITGSIVSGNTVTYDFQGIIEGGTPIDPSGVPPPTPLQLIFGDLSLLSSEPISGYFTYDTAASNWSPWPDRAFYSLPPGNPLVFFVAGKKITAFDGEVDILPWHPTSTDIIRVYTLGDIAVDGTVLPRLGGNEMGISFVSEAPLPNLSLPLDLSLSKFNEAVGTVKDGFNGFFDFTVTSLNERVPESASTGLLLIIGVSTLGLVRRGLLLPIRRRRFARTN